MGGSSKTRAATLDALDRDMDRVFDAVEDLFNSVPGDFVDHGSLTQLESVLARLATASKSAARSVRAVKAVRR